MKKVVFGALAVLMIVAGVVWALQGLGYVGGSSMTGNETWAIIGPIFAGLGVALLIVTIRGPRP
jgi:glucokinase